MLSKLSLTHSSIFSKLSKMYIRSTHIFQFLSKQSMSGFPMRIKRAWARVMATLNLLGKRVKMSLDKNALDQPKGCAILESPYKSMNYFFTHTGDYTLRLLRNPRRKSLSISRYSFLVLLTVDKMITLLSCPWNSSTLPTLISPPKRLFSIIFWIFCTLPWKENSN